jgi:CMP-N,N'-diacetyllegionaminic acid synthase
MTPKPSSVVALVPAKGTSLRLPGKNVQPLAGHPVIAYTISAARDASIFTVVLVSTESPEIAEIAERYGATVVERPAALAEPMSPDVEWLLHAMDGRTEDAFAILRPTSPFRTAETIRRAWGRFIELGDQADSIRAVQPCRQHPAKMWIVEDDLMRPVLARQDGGTPWHSMQTQSLPQVWAQDSSLEIAWRHVLEGDAPSISGDRVAPFFTERLEGFSIDYPDDFERAESLEADLPRVLEVVP